MVGANCNLCEEYITLVCLTYEDLWLVLKLCYFDTDMGVVYIRVENRKIWHSIPKIWPIFRHGRSRKFVDIAQFTTDNRYLNIKKTLKVKFSTLNILYYKKLHILLYLFVSCNIDLSQYILSFFSYSTIGHF